MSAGSECDDLFDHLVQKQADREVHAIGEEKLTEALKTKLSQLFSEVKEKGAEFGPLDLAHWQAQDVNISSSLVVFAAFIKGMPLPMMDDPEVQSESLGELGACFNAGSKLFGFRDSVTELVHLPQSRGLQDDWADRIMACPRFSVFYSTLMNMAYKWSGCHSSVGEEDGDGAPVTFEFEGSWAGEPAKTLLEQFMRLTFENAKIYHGNSKLEQIEFEVEMRRAFGKS